MAKLREAGFQAYGVEIDLPVMERGFSLLRGRGFHPEELLRDVKTVAEFDEASFELIFSEQVFEHVSDLNAVARSMARLTKAGGLGVNTYPSRRSIVEEHLFMPFIHWLPKRPIRRPFLWLQLASGKGPKSGWPGMLDAPRAAQVEAFYDYLDRKTFYRDNREIMSIFEQNGFKAAVKLRPRQLRLARILPVAWRVNGFPESLTILYLKKCDYSGLRTEEKRLSFSSAERFSGTNTKQKY